MTTDCELFQIVDSDDAILWDCVDTTGANNPHGLQTTMWNLDLGRIPTGLDIARSISRPGGRRIRSQADVRITSWAQGFTGITDGTAATKPDLIREAFGVFAQLLEEGNSNGSRIRYRLVDDHEMRYIEFLGTDSLPSLVHAQQNAYTKLFENFHDPDGVLIELISQPYHLGAELSSDTNKLKNAVLLWVGATANRPGLWAWSSTANLSDESIVTGITGPLRRWYDAYQFDLATTSTRSLQQTTDAGSFAAGDVVTKSFYVWAETAGIVRARAAVQFVQADGTTVVGAEAVGPLTDIGNGWTRVDVTTPAAGANTSRAIVSIRFQNIAATQTTIRLAAAQAEVGSSASLFVVGTEPVYNDPVSTTGPGRVLPTYIHGDAPAPVQFVSTAWAVDAEHIFLATRSNGTDRALADYLNTTKVFQVENATVGTDTSVVTSATEADFSPGSGNVGTTTTFATNAAMTLRLTCDLAAPFDARTGVYDVYLRSRLTVANGVVKLRLRQGFTAGGSDDGTAVTHPNPSPGITEDWKIGRIYIPADLGANSYTLRIDAERTSGTAALRMDCLFFVPVEESAAIMNAGQLAVGDTVTSHPEDGLVILKNSSGAMIASLDVKGPVPAFVPPGLGVVSQMQLVPDVQAAAVPITGNGNLKHVYAPRYLA